MKKRVISFLLILVTSMLCLGCSKDSDTNADQPVVDNDKQEVEQTVENSEEQETEEDSIGRTKITDPEMIATVKELLLAEQDLLFHLSVKWTDSVDLSKEYKFKGDENIYYRVTEEGITSWDDYENIAKEIYTEAYITEEFNPMYKNIYVEKKGKLYRAIADGVGTPIVEDSIEIFESTEGRFYVAVFECNVDGEFETSRIIEAAEGSKYGYLIAENIGYVK